MTLIVLNKTNQEDMTLNTDGTTKKKSLYGLTAVVRLYSDKENDVLFYLVGAIEEIGSIRKYDNTTNLYSESMLEKKLFYDGQ